jgi:hypothetical protein
MELSRDLYYEGRYEEALVKLDKLVADASGKDRSLLLLERGKTRLAAGEYDSAIVDLQEAEDRFLEIEATYSVGDFFKNTLLNPGMGEYQPESHEKILISAYLLLAYWLGGDREGAFVERNRVVGRLEQYLEDLSDEDREKLDVPFARYLAGLLYEIEGMEDDARIEYGVVEKIRKNAAPPDVNSRLTELALFTEVGRAPVKVSTEIRGYLNRDAGLLVGTFFLPDAADPFIFGTGVSSAVKIDNPGVLFTFAFPQYLRQERRICSCVMVIDGLRAGKTVPFDYLEETAIAAFNKNLGMILLKAAFRTYIKTTAQTKLKNKAGGVVDIFGKVLSAVDRADTRSWQTLPSEIHLFRMETAPGEHKVHVEYLDADGGVVSVSKQVTFHIEKGNKQIIYLPGPS